MSSIEDHTPMRKMTPEEHVELLEAQIEILENRERENERSIRRDLVSQLINQSLVGDRIGAEDDVIARAEALAQYILNGKGYSAEEKLTDAHGVLSDLGVEKGDEGGDYALTHRIRLLFKTQNTRVEDQPKSIGVSPSEPQDCCQASEPIRWPGVWLKINGEAIFVQCGDRIEVQAVKFVEEPEEPMVPVARIREFIKGTDKWLGRAVLSGDFKQGHSAAMRWVEREFGITKEND